MKPLTLLLALALTGCSVATPLPITPIQMMDGTWPPPDRSVPVGVTSKPYTIKGDTFTYPALGMAITRASEDDWSFLPGNNAINVMFRDKSVVPQPVLSLQQIALPPGTDVAAALGADKANLEAAGSTVTVATRQVGGQPGESWTFDQTDPQSGLTMSFERIYVLQGDILVLVQAMAGKDVYAQLKPAFDTMINSIALATAPTEGEAAEDEAETE